MTIRRPSGRTRRPLALVGAIALVLLAVLGAAPRAGAQEDATEPTPTRLLVLSLPGVTWADVSYFDLPNLEAVLDGSAMADLAPRGVFPRSGPGDAYLTISAGSRATTIREIDGQVLAVDEQATGSQAGDIYRRRTGDEPDGPFVSLAWPSLQRANAAEPFESQLGSLTDALEEGDVSAAAIGNADGVDSVGPSYERQVGLALADSTGVVPAGELGKGLLLDDPAAPFGVRLDPERVEDAFTTAWDDAARPGGAGGVVLVEGSDLARTLRYRPIVDYERYRVMWMQALQDTDEMVGRLLDAVDPAADTVLVVAPYNQRGDRDLTIAALRGPGVESGYLRSASTQRSGFLTLVDIGPTILDVFGLDRPAKMEGRPAVSVANDASTDERIDHLISLNDASRFRENLLTPTTTVVVLGFAALLAATIAAHANRWSGRARAAIWFFLLVDLAILPASYLARFFALEERGAGFYWTVLSIGALAIAGAAAGLGRARRSQRGALIGVLAMVALVLIADVVTGSRLSISAAFGYSATGNSRLYGISNYSYGQLAAATCLVAAWLAGLRPPRGGPLVGTLAMLLTLIVLGAPLWGSDVGGVLAFTPAVATFAVIATGRRVRLRTLAIGGAATAVAIGAFGLLDLARAPADRGHLGRLFERIGAEGPSPVISMIERKLAANLEVSTSSLWVLAIPLGIAFWVFLQRFPDGPYRQITGRFPTLPAGLTAALVAGVLGSALNDSGAIIGGIMAMVVGAALAALLLEGGPPPVHGTEAEAASPADAPAVEGREPEVAARVG